MFIISLLVSSAFFWFLCQKISHKKAVLYWWGKPYKKIKISTSFLISILIFVFPSAHLLSIIKQLFMFKGTVLSYSIRGNSLANDSLMSLMIILMTRFSPNMHVGPVIFNFLVQFSGLLSQISDHLLQFWGHLSQFWVHSFYPTSIIFGSLVTIFQVTRKLW